MPLFLCRGEKEGRKEGAAAAAAALLYSCLLFRGQQRSGFDKAAFLSKPVFDKSWMEPVLFVLCSG